MNKPEQEHINYLAAIASELMKTKYAKGVKEHGGGLWKVGEVIARRI